jgi:hypothetical protein
LNPDGSGKIYLHIFRWPDDGNFSLNYTGYGGRVTKAYLLADPKTSVEATINKDSNSEQSELTLKLPTTAPDPIASVVCLEVKP